VRPEGLGKLDKIHLIGTRSRDIPVCSIVPQPQRYRVPQVSRYAHFKIYRNQVIPRVGRLTSHSRLSIFVLYHVHRRLSTWFIQ
jgi:hypothetical protein